MSEFHLLSGHQTTNVYDLTNAIKKKAPLIRQKLQVANATKKLLQKPLDKVHAEKVISMIFKYIYLIAFLAFLENDHDVILITVFLLLIIYIITYLNC